MLFQMGMRMIRSKDCIKEGDDDDTNIVVITSAKKKN